MTLVDQVFARSDQVLWLWNFYVVIVVATLAATVLIPAIREHRTLRNGLMGLFGFLAYANLESMRWVLKQWQCLLEANPQPSSALDAVLAAPHPLWVFPFHLTLDAFVLFAIWRLARKTESLQRTAPDTPS
jgi:hypothetical protein